MHQLFPTSSTHITTYWVSYYHHRSLRIIHHASLCLNVFSYLYLSGKTSHKPYVMLTTEPIAGGLISFDIKYGQ